MSSIRARDFFVQMKSLPMPKETIGACKNAYAKRGNSKPCKSYSVVLGDGLCMHCWDRNLSAMSWVKKKTLKAVKEG